MDDLMASNGSIKEQHKISKEEEDYIDKLLAEKKLVSQFNPDLDYIPRLLAQEIERVQNGGRLPGREEHKKFCDVTKDKPIKVTIRALVPVKDHPKFNFVGKLLGPKGNSLKRLQEETLTKMAILGRGSMRDKQKEEECRQSAEARYKHLNEDLHVEISAFAAPAEAHARIALALTEIRRFLVPDYNDEIRQEQLREMQMMNATGPGQPGTVVSSAADLLMAAAASAAAVSNNSDHPLGHSQAGSVNSSAITSNVAGTANSHSSSSSNSSMGTTVCPSVPSAPTVRHPNANLPSLNALGIPSGAMPGGLAAPGLGARVPAPCAPMLPLLHPALRGLCKPAQSIGIGFGPAAVQRHSGLIAGAAAAGRFRPNLPPSSMMSSTARRNMLTILNRMREQGKDDFLDPTNDLAFLDLYGRYSLSYEGSDGVGSPDDREDGPEENFAGTVPSEFALVDGTCLKMTSFERTRYRHDPYPRPTAELTYVHEGPSVSHTGS